MSDNPEYDRALAGATELDLPRAPSSPDHLGLPKKVFDDLTRMAAGDAEEGIPPDCSAEAVLAALARPDPGPIVRPSVGRSPEGFDIAYGPQLGGSVPWCVVEEGACRHCGRRYLTDEERWLLSPPGRRFRAGSRARGLAEALARVSARSFAGCPALAKEADHEAVRNWEAGARQLVAEMAEEAAALREALRAFSAQTNQAPGQ